MTYIPALCAAFEDPRFAVLRTIRNVILPAGLAVLLAAVSLWRSPATTIFHSIITRTSNPRSPN